MRCEQYPRITSTGRGGPMSRMWYGIALLCRRGELSRAGEPGARARRRRHGHGGEFAARPWIPRRSRFRCMRARSVSDVLKALTDKGFRIKWNPTGVADDDAAREAEGDAHRQSAERDPRALGYAGRPNLLDGGYRVKPLKKKKSKVTVGTARRRLLPVRPLIRVGDSNHSRLQSRMIRNKMRAVVGAD